MRICKTSDRLKQLMIEKNMRQVDVLQAAKPFCQKYGVKLAKNDLSQYVSGKVEPGQDKLSIMGLALDVSETWLMGYDVPRSREQINSPAEPELTEGEKMLIELYRKLPEDRKEFVIATIKVALEKL